MSVHHLPDDLRRWPRDPYQVLGVAPRCDPLVARKAYTRLIRHFKPEQYPEHFRLIREAYDTVKREAQFLGSANGNAAADFAGPSPDAAAAVPSSTPGLAQPAGGADMLQILWDKATGGQEEEAYGRLREMCEISPQGSELLAHLYALLLANPELDPRRTPCDWLVRGVRTEPTWGPCRQLYRREIDDHPEEVLSNRFLCLLDAAQGRNIVEFLALRWEALARLEQTEWIAADLRRVAPRLERADEEAWVRVLLKATDYLAWQRFKLFDNLCKDIEGHVHVHSVLGEDLSRLDFLRDLSSSWHKLGGKTAKAPLVKVLPLSWTSPFENRHRILLQCRAVADNPETALDKMDEVQRLAPLIPAHLGQTLPWLWNTTDPREETALLPAITDHVGGLVPVSETDYSLYRRQLLRLCLAEVIAPETVANTLNPNSATFAWQRIHDDWPLRVVCLAHRLIWA
jgi:hypothetical protein